MTFLNLMYVAFGGAAGSMARYGVSSLIGHYDHTSFPFGTFAVNIIGSLLMGALLASIALLVPAKGKDLHLILAVGFLGGFTTFSAFSFDTYMLFERGLWLELSLYVAGSVGLSVLAFFAGMWLTKAAIG